MISKIIKTARPFVLGHTIVICTILSILASFSLYKAIIATIAVTLTHTFAQLTNMLHDIELDSVNIHKCKRPSVTGELNLTRTKFLLELMLLITVITAYYVSVGFLVRLLILLNISALFSLTFTLRRNAFIHAITMAICRGFMPPFVFLGIKGLKLSILFFLWALALNVSKDVNDVEADRKFGIKTIAQYGDKKLKIWMYFWLSMFYVYVTFLSLHNPYMLLILTTLPFAISIPQSIRMKPAYSDNNLAYDNYWWGMTLIYIILLLISQYQVP